MRKMFKNIFKFTVIAANVFISVNSFAKSPETPADCPPIEMIVDHSTFYAASPIFGMWGLYSDEFDFQGNEWRTVFKIGLPSKVESEAEALKRGQAIFNAEAEALLSTPIIGEDQSCIYADTWGESGKSKFDVRAIPKIHPMCMKNIEEHITKNWLNINDCNLNDSDIPAIIKVLDQHKEIIYLSAERNSISDEGATALAKRTTLRQINLEFNLIGDLGAIELAKNFRLHKLNLGWNYRIGDVGARALAGNTSLDDLDLQHNRIGNAGAIALANNISIRWLYLDDNKIGDEGAKAFMNNTNIESLDLESNQISDEGAVALSSNTTIETLDLGHNHISDNGAIAFAKNDKLQRLSLDHNQIGDRGAIQLAKNSTLEYLGLGRNIIGDAGAIAFANNMTLYRLDLSYNQIGEAGLAALANNKHLNVDTEGNNETLSNPYHIKKKNPLGKHHHHHFNSVKPKNNE